MKKHILLFTILLIANTVLAQVKQVITTIQGDCEIVVQTGDHEYITLDAYGEILAINMRGDVDHYSDFNDYEAGKIKRIGDVNFTYYSDFNDYETGKIKRVGNVDFIYYSKFNHYETGKIKRIGNIDFTYYSDFNAWESGKIKRIGNTNFTYYSDFNDYETGKIKEIGNNSYTYFSGIGNNKLKGKLKSGNSYFEDRGIIFRIKRYHH